MRYKRSTDTRADALGASNDLVNSLGAERSQNGPTSQCSLTRSYALRGNTHKVSMLLVFKPAIDIRPLATRRQGDGGIQLVGSCALTCDAKIELTGKVDGMLLDQLLGLVRVESGEREHTLIAS